MDTLGTHIVWEIKSEQGDIKFSCVQECKSLLNNFSTIMAGIFKETSVSYIKNTYGNAQAVTSDAKLKEGAVVASGNDSCGIIIGSSSAAVALDDYIIGSKISHSSGYMQYHATSDSDITLYESVSDDYTQVERLFTNDSPSSDITIRECALYIKFDAIGTTPYYYCVLREVFSSPAVLSPGDTLTIRIRIRIAL